MSCARSSGMGALRDQRREGEPLRQQALQVAEDPRVEEDAAADGPVPRRAPEREQEAEDDRDRERDRRERDSEKRSRPERPGRERFPEQMPVEGGEQRYFTSPVGMLYFFASAT